MHFDALSAVSDRLANDAAIATYLDTEFPGIEVFHSIGIKPDWETGTGVPADCFPYIAVSPMNDQRFYNKKNSTEQVSILFGVHNDTRTGTVFDGLRQVCELGELILAALELQPLTKSPSVTWNHEAQIRSDAGLQHPFYEGEIVIPVEIRL
jgi:hypothetical protein